jgi:nucleoid-associated protein YgaU
LKTEWPGEKREDTDQSDSLDLYKDEMARNAVGSLFDDDEPSAAEESAGTSGRYVTGFDKPAQRTRTAPEEESPDLEMEEEADDDAESMMVTINRRRIPGREPNPAPRPAVRVPQTASRDKLSMPKSRPINLDEDETLSDDFDSFRQRYKNHDSVPAPRRPGRERPDRAARAERPPRTGFTAPPPDENNEPSEITPIIRWAGIIGVAVVLVIMAFMVYRINTLNARLREAGEQIIGAPVNDSEITELRLELEKKDEIIRDLEHQIAWLQSNSETQQEGGVIWGDPIFEDEIPTEGMSQPNETPETPATATASGLPTSYTVVSGDNLSRISTRFYGNANPASVQRIMDANGLTSTLIHIGDVLIIPAE